MIWILIWASGLLGVGLMAFAGWKLLPKSSATPQAETHEEPIAKAVAEPSAPAATAAKADPAAAHPAPIVSTAPTTAPALAVDPIVEPVTDTLADLSALNALTTPTHHMEEEYLKWLSEEEKHGRTVTADEAFWTQDIDIVRQWASENSYEPGPEWGVILSGTIALDEIISLAEDPSFQNDWDEYFIGSAYIRVGDVKLQADASNDPTLTDDARQTIATGQASASPHVREWAQLAQQYLSGQNISPEHHDLFTWRPDSDG